MNTEWASFPGVKQPGRDADHSRALRLRISGAICPISLCTFRAWKRKTLLYFTLLYFKNP